MGAESRGAARVSRAEVADAELLGRLQHRFQAEFEEPGPDAALFAERITVLLEEGLTAALLVHAPEPAGFALLRHRTGYCSRAREAYLAELYVIPERRGEGLGRALLDAVLELSRELGCDRIDLGTAVGDSAARGLYERMGFSNYEGTDRDPESQMLFYERDL